MGVVFKRSCKVDKVRETTANNADLDTFRVVKVTRFGENARAVIGCQHPCAKLCITRQ